MKSSSVLSFILLCLLSSWIVHGQNLDDPVVVALRQGCIDETGASHEMIGKGNNDKILVTDRALMCYMKCTMIKAGIMGPEGNVDIDVGISYLTPEQKKNKEATMRSCGSVKGSDDCETAFLTYKCHLEKDPANFYIV